MCGVFGVAFPQRSVVGFRSPRTHGGLAFLHTAMLRVGVITLILGLGFFPARGGEPPDPQALYDEAQSLGTRADLVSFGKGNLIIHGTNLEGDGVRRPSMLLARAAEIWAERAIASGKFDPNTKFEIHGKFDDMTHALLIWRDLRDWNTPIGYLRLLRKQAGTGNVSLAAACDYEIGQCYEQQGDVPSAEEIYRAYASVPCENDNIGRCKAAYALALIKDGQYKEALEQAKAVLDKCRPQEIVTIRDKDAHGLALQALNSIPAEAQGLSATAVKDTEENTLLAQAKENPRRYFRLGQMAEQRKDLPKAIEYYALYRRSFPTDETALNLGVRIGGLLEQQKNPAKAMECYEQVWKPNPNAPQAAAARVAAAKILVQGGKLPDAVKLIKEGIEKATAASVRAELISNLAEIYLNHKMVDEAVEQFIELMNKYGEQNAAQGAIARLKKAAPLVKNWRPVTQQIYTWLVAGMSGKPMLGTGELRPQAASDLRRLALTFFVQNREFREGTAWLTQCGAKCRDEDVSYIVLDEAWFCGEALRITNGDINNSPTLRLMVDAKAQFRGRDMPTILREAPGTIDMGLRGWQIAKDKKEGWDALQETARFVTLIKPKSDRTRKVCDELRSLFGTPYEEQATGLLLNVLDALGDKKEAEKIRQAK